MLSHGNQLQWGHDQLIVEGANTRANHPSPVVLQWGHDQLIVEGGSRVSG